LSKTKGFLGLDSYDIILNLALHIKDKTYLTLKLATALFLMNILEQTGYFDQLEEFKGELKNHSVFLKTKNSNSTNADRP